MSTPRTPFLDYFRVADEGLPTVDHGGADAGYRSDMTRFPEQHFSVAVLCNYVETRPSSLARAVADIYLAQDLKAAEPSTDATAAPGSGISLTEQQLSGLEGLYCNRDDDQFLKTHLKDGKLRVSFNIEDDYALKPVSETLFHIADTPWGDQASFHFEPAAGDKPRRFLQSFGDGKPDLFEFISSFTPTASELADYAGSYVSQEIEPVYRMVVQDGKLTLTRLKYKPAPLEPRTLDVFTAEIGTIPFTRDPNHRVCGFVLNSGRIRNFRFTRCRLVVYEAINLIAYAFYIAVTLLFYYMFKPVNRRLSWLAAFLGLVGCANDVLGLFNIPLYRISSLVFFGPYCLLIGCLILRSTFLPRILGVLMAFAGLGWLIYLLPLANHLSYLKVLGFLAELSLCVWLLVKGVNAQRWKEQASAAVRVTNHSK